MKILHTADWHLGAKTEGKSRIEEQKQVMDEIVDIARAEKVDLVIISGDVFDQAVPTSDAENLFYETLEKLSAKKECVVVAIAGNHDDPKRLTAGEHFARKHNVILAGNLKPNIINSEFSKGRISSSSNGSIEIQLKKSRGVEKCVVAMLPYPQEYRFEEVSKADTYAGKVKDFARIVAKGFKSDTFNVFASHLMLVGSTANINGEEKILRVGDVNAITKADLPQADYYALGHIHSFQNMKGNFCYSGSPLFYDFKQKTAGVVIIETKNKNSVKSVEYKELKSPAKMAEIEVSGVADARAKLSEFNERDIVNLTFVQNEPLSMSLIKELKLEYPCLTKVMLRLKTMETDDKNYVCNRSKLEAGSLFTEFYKQKRLVEPSRELVALFKNILEDTTSETN